MIAVSLQELVLRFNLKMNEKIKSKILDIKPNEIEKKSFSIIKEELSQMGITLDEENEATIIRAIHTTADFSYAENLFFSDGACQKGIDALKNGATIITDTTMAMSGINKTYLAKLGASVKCFIADEEVKEMAESLGVTRSFAAVLKASKLKEDVIFAVGNAPTALMALYDLIEKGKISPKLIIAAPVGFVNVEASKELIRELDVPQITAMGRKGGSNLAAAICNSLIYKAAGRKI